MGLGSRSVTKAVLKYRAPTSSLFVGLLLVVRIVDHHGFLSQVLKLRAARTNLGRVRKRPPGRKTLRAEILKVHGGKYPPGASLGRDTRSELTIRLTPSTQ